MKTRVLFCVALGWGLLFSGCSRSLENVSFTGKWRVIKVSEIADQNAVSTVNVTVDRNQFKIASEDPESATLDIYDGESLTHATTNLQASISMAPSAPLAPVISKKSDMEVAFMRFWKKNYSGTGMPGGPIAGRETLLYQNQENNFGRVTTLQTWVDPETKVVLKRIYTNYSSQLEQVISKTTEECQEIHYGPVDASAFKRN